MFKSRYIQANGPTHKYWLVFDVDKPNASLDWYDSGAPAPNIVATNRDNGHAHLIYGLEVSIRTAPDGRSAPLRYAAVVENALREKLGADIGYAGLICKNPLNPHWQVSTWEPCLYEAYKAIRLGWPEYERWLEACLTRAEGYNKKTFKEPLPQSEIKATAKSVARWTHKNFSAA